MITTIYSPLHTRHNPPHEFMEGRLNPFPESPSRALMIHDAVVQAGLGPIIAPEEFGLDPVRAVHSDNYLTFLRTFHGRWRSTEGLPEVALPSALAVRAMGRYSPALHAEIGYYSFDLSVPIAEHTYETALTSAQSALTGAALLLRGERIAYALCRPPGHHAHSDLMGGFCYLNNAAIAANYLARSANARVALLDIDVHAGNGTQAIFYERPDVLFLSIHGSPEWEYPYFAGFADECGTGAGEGLTVNYPLERGVDNQRYLEVLGAALGRIAAFAPQYLVLSAGFDTFDGDPLGKFKVTTEGFAAIGARIATAGLPTLVVQEGGYAVSALGTNAVSLLRGVVEYSNR